MRNALFIERRDMVSSFAYLMRLKEEDSAVGCNLVADSVRGAWSRKKKKDSTYVCIITEDSYRFFGSD